MHVHERHLSQDPTLDYGRFMAVLWPFYGRFMAVFTLEDGQIVLEEQIV